MVARPPTERLTPWLKPVGGEHHKESRGALVLECFPVACCYVTLGLFRRDFGEEGHLRHGHKREPQQLEKDPDDEGRQLPSVAAWRKEF